MPKSPQYLVVVREGERELFERLLASTAGPLNGVRVVWDRRRRDRRVIIQDVEGERRRHERRAPPDPAWETRSFIVVRTDRASRHGSPPNGHRTCLEIPLAAALVC